MNTTYQHITQQVNNFALLLLAFCMPLNDRLGSISIFLWVLTWILKGQFKIKITSLPNKWLFWGLILYFSFYLIYLPRAYDFSNGIYKIEQKLSILVFPIIFILSNNQIKSNTATILKAFILGNITASLLCIFNAVNNCFNYINGLWVFNYHVYEYPKNTSFWETISVRTNYFSGEFLSIFKAHSYFSMYIAFSVLIIIYFFRTKIIKTKLSKIFYGVSLVFFTIMMFLLQSRSNFVALPIITITLIINELHKNYNTKKLLIYLGIFCLTISAIFSSEHIRNNIHEIKNISLNNFVTNIKDYDLRYREWYAATKLIKENFWFGTSPANASEQLNNMYGKLGYDIALKNSFNAHNQYLQSFLENGIFGFLILIFIIAYGFIAAIKQHNFLLFFLVLLLSVNFLFESMLNRMAGVVFMMFFLNLFSFVSTHKLNKQ